mmetsp:Transcript_10792/g.27167  ORF Transcript_10792/g.27167 Transcript_10792/m.27167 type:complete len:216 (+) Transcript_10792:245-892(+)
MSILRHPAPSAALNKNRENVYMGPNLVNSGDRLALSSKQNTFVPLVLLRPSAKGHGAAEDGAVGHGLDGDAEVALELLRHAVHVQEQRHVQGGLVGRVDALLDALERPDDRVKVGNDLVLCRLVQRQDLDLRQDRENDQQHHRGRDKGRLRDENAVVPSLVWVHRVPDLLQELVLGRARVGARESAGGAVVRPHGVLVSVHPAGSLDGLVGSGSL